MKKKHLFIAATALLAFASCADDGFVGDENAKKSGEGAISFGGGLPKTTRATQEDATAATTLGNKFIVWGEKNETNGDAATAANTVFKNYTVQYGASTAHTTLSNTDDWEYVGVTSYTTKLTPNAPTPQTIKYWDNDASSYTFTAVSALDADVTGDKVVITKVISGSTVYDKGYTIAVKDGATSSKIFFADRINDTPANLNSRAVKLTFRNLQAKLRFGIYETVPGYTVSIDKVYYNGTNSTTNFGVDGKFIKPAANTSFTVTYGNGTTTGPANKAIVAVSADTYNSFIASTSTTIMSAASIGTTSPGATMDDYVSILPYPSNATNLSFTIDYTLKSEDTNEEIEIKGKTVNVPAAYCKWQANYAYTYLFKITDSDLTPITFDACYIEDEVGNQETITTVSEPSITTYTKGKVVTANDEYVTGNTIYAAVEDAAVDPSNPTLTVGTNAKLYFVTLESGAAQTITEASVANALVHGTTNATDKTWTVTDALTKKMVVTDTESNLLTAITQIPATDSPTGADLSIKGAKFAPAAKYVQVPENTDLTEGVTYYTSDAGAGGSAAGASEKASASTYRKVSDATGAYVFEYIRGNVYEAATGTYVAGTKYYTDANGSSEVDTTSFEAGVTDVSSYFVLASPAVKTYKVIKVVAAP